MRRGTSFEEGYSMVARRSAGDYLSIVPDDDIPCPMVED
jgi:hypothetical protein